MSYFDNDNSECNSSSIKSFFPILFFVLVYLVIRWYNNTDTRNDEIKINFKFTQEYLDKHRQEDEDFFFSKDE